MRAKFRVEKIVDNAADASFGVNLSAVQSDESIENQDFNKFTPFGELEMFIDNPDAEGFFQEGKEYYLDFTKAE